MNNCSDFSNSSKIKEMGVNIRMHKHKNVDKDAEIYLVRNKLTPKQQLMLLENKKVSKWTNLYFILGGSLGAIFYIAARLINNYESTPENPWNLHIGDYIIAVIIWLFISSAFIIVWNLLNELKITKYKRKIVNEEINDITTKDVFENSLQMSHKYLEQYYLQTREHAQKGFIVTITVSICGAIIVAAGTIAMFIGNSNAAYVTTASGVITEFIAAVFFYLYNKTVQSMGAYHNKLVLSQNIALALKIADSLSCDAKNDAKRDIINELIKDANNHITAVDDPSN